MRKLLILILILVLTMVLTACGGNKVNSNETSTNQNAVVEEEKTEDLEDKVEVDDIDVSDMVIDPGITTDGKIDSYLVSFEKELGEVGLKLENKVIKDAASIGALEGFGFNINDFPLEVYLFDLASKDEKTKENLKTARESGFITIFGVEINGKTPTSKCTINDSLVLIFPMEDFGMPHPDKEAIVQAFMEI